MGKFRWTELVANEVLRRVQDRNILNIINRKKDNCTGLILRRNCLLKHVIEGNIEGRIEVTRRLTRRLRPLLDDLKEKIGYSKLKKGSSISHSVWGSFGRGYGPVVRQTTKWVNKCITLCTIRIYFTAYSWV
jgi:hypothetical protein